MSELNDSLLDLGSTLIEYSIRFVLHANCDQCHLGPECLTSLWTYCLDRWMEEERKKEITRQVQRGKKVKKSQPAVFSMCMLCILPAVARFCILYAFCCFLLSRSPAMGNLIKVLGKDLENCPHFFLDFESKWAPGCVHVSVCWKCERTCVWSRGVHWVVAGWGQGRYVWMWADWWCDGVLLWVWFVIISCSLVPLSVLSDTERYSIQS